MYRVVAITLIEPVVAMAVAKFSLPTSLSHIFPLSRFFRNAIYPSGHPPWS